MYKIVMIGSGNLAWHLALAFEEGGAKITQVYSRTLKNARELATQLYDCQAVTSLDFTHIEADVFILALSDNALAEVVAQLQTPPDSIILHTSGSQALAVLEPLGTQIGVFYPLQTFSKSKKVDFTHIPLCLESTNEATLEVMVELADLLSQDIFQVSTPDRLKLHLSAVFACNFTNHLLAIAKNLLVQNDLEFDLLKPLIEETFQKALQTSAPEAVQTGPARRNDTEIIGKHLAMLADNPNYQVIYDLLTKSIQKGY